MSGAFRRNRQRTAANGLDAMNWTRGLFRLWIVASLVWGGLILAIVFANAPLPDAGLQRAGQIILIPPFAALALGAALMWAIRGFRS